MKNRLVALDWMRGIVMVLMTLDHASGAFNADKLVTDTAFLYTPGDPLPAAQFFTRWVTHLCAPTFLFLAGTALALSLERRVARGEPARTLDRYLLTRGLIIAALDPLLISWLWEPGHVFLQVLYAIGLSLILMIPLRRLRTRWLLVVGFGFFAVGEVLVGLAILAAGGEPGVIGGFLVHPGVFPGLMIVYPVLPWLAMMIVGWVFGRWLLEARAGETRWSPTQLLAVAGGVALLVFLAVRGANGYGNMTLYMDGGDPSVIQWLHVSKYPPSLTFVALELGIMALVLAILWRVQERLGDRVRANNPILVFGQTALFFYVLHIPLLELTAHSLGVHKALGLPEAYIACAGALVVLYPVCLWYRRYKASHPQSWARYI